MTPKETRQTVYEHELLANKQLHTFIQRNPGTAKWISPNPVTYDPVAQTYYYLAHYQFLIDVYDNMRDLNMRYTESAYFTLVTKLMNNE